MKSKETSIRLDAPLHKRLVKEADRTQTSISFVIRDACRMYLDAQDKLRGQKEKE